MTPGKLDITVKINTFPEARTIENNWKEFDVDCEGVQATIKIKPKQFKKLEQAKENYPMWVAAISGKMGEFNHSGFTIAQASIQVFEKKPKEPKEATEKQPELAATTS